MNGSYLCMRLFDGLLVRPYILEQSRLSAVLIQKLFNLHINNYQSLGLILGTKRINFFFLDKRSDDWFLMNSVWAPMTVTAFYLYFIFNLGPRLMKNRPPMQLNTIIKIYDILQVILNCYMAERVRNTDMDCQINCVVRTRVTVN